MIRYFGDYTHQRLDLSGTQVFGWYPLDKSVNEYNALGQGARDQLVVWARKAATDHGVNLSPFYSVVVCTNLWQDIGVGAAKSGVVAQGTTAIPRLLGHEMGHVYGLDHSRIDGSNVAAIRGSGVKTLSGIADALNARGIRSARGGKWHVSAVENLIARSDALF